ncbi:MAG: S-adenosylmethionine:tRNA ribosyltransferase-isomerase, partial [Planctomycetota bacterium]
RELDAERYQTVYARDDGDDFSVAAPTAGLHFTPELLQQAVAACAGKIELQLEVGLGTFQPVRADDIREHPMHAERFRLSGDALRTLRAHRAGGGRVVAVGTTSARVLETLAQHDAGATGLPAQIADMPGGGVEGQTAIFIHPPRRPSGFDALITNFHLPESTLVMLVAALLGRERTLDLYREAVARSYRFFSYGDAMFIRQF